MDKCPAVELEVPQYPPEKKKREKKIIAHGPSNMPVRVDMFLISKVLDLRVWHSSPRIPF